MSTYSAVSQSTWDKRINAPALRKAVILLLAALVLLSLLFPYIQYTVPAYEGYDEQAALTQAQADYIASVQEYENNVILRDETEVQIAEVLQPAYDEASAALEAQEALETPDEAALAAATAAEEETKTALTDARKVLSGLQNLIAPVPVQNPVPADAKGR